MIITISFQVKNYVEVMEGWPIKIGDKTFFLEREGNVAKRVSISFSNVDVGHAANFIPPTSEGGVPEIRFGSGVHVHQAIQYILNWQAVVSGLQIFDIDYDHYEIRFHPQTIEEEGKISLKSFSRTGKDASNSACDFEQIGRAFCVGQIEDTRIESTSHFREGRIAFEAGRYVDSFNNMFLFLETRYCDGKTGTGKQVALLEKSEPFCEAFQQAIQRLKTDKLSSSRHLSVVFDTDASISNKIKQVVELRGKLRHHSLKSPHRWDPNRQDEYEMPARFLSAVVGEIVLKESIDDIYSPKALEQFMSLSVEGGFETKFRVKTYRLEREPALVLDMSYPTTVISSKVCLSTARNALHACNQNDQLADTVRLDTVQSKRNLELFTLELGTWAYTESRSLRPNDGLKTIRCSF